MSGRGGLYDGADIATHRCFSTVEQNSAVARSVSANLWRGELFAGGALVQISTIRVIHRDIINKVSHILSLTMYNFYDRCFITKNGDMGSMSELMIWITAL